MDRLAARNFHIGGALYFGGCARPREVGIVFPCRFTQNGAMQTLREIRGLLEAFGLTPRKRFGQNFLFDQNLMLKLLELAEVDASQTVLEVGPGTGSLTEELLERAGKVVAVEIDSGMHRLLQERLQGKANLALLHQDILVGKHAMAQEVVQALGGRANLVANLPYNIATPLVAQCLVSSWKAKRGLSSNPSADSESVPDLPRSVLFDRLTFTVQQEVADRMVAPHGSWEYGPVSVIVALLGEARFGPVIPNTAFWPKPQVTSRIVRIDFQPGSAARLADIAALQAVVTLAFGQRRKQIGSVIHRKNAPFEIDDFTGALDQAGIPRTFRAEEIAPDQFLAVANALAGKFKGTGVEDDLT
jgi:16S rRNA (adenine1518-N6/adenine1519-N6)-dimethyltransferase